MQVIQGDKLLNVFVRAKYDLCCNFVSTALRVIFLYKCGDVTTASRRLKSPTYRLVDQQIAQAR